MYAEKILKFLILVLSQNVELTHRVCYRLWGLAMSIHIATHYDFMRVFVFCDNIVQYI